MPQPPRVVVALGNPGSEYDGTRHNVGFRVADRLAGLRGRSFHAKGRALRSRVSSDDAEREVWLLQPTTYMNRSGRAVRDVEDECGAWPELLVVCDDFNLPLGKLRCRGQGSAGGQKGLASILDVADGRPVPRLRMGIGDPGRAPAEEFVLRPFKRAEQADVDDMVERAALAIDAWLDDGDLEALIRRANQAEPTPD